MDHSYPYIASLTREPFLFYEMRSTAKLMAEGNSDDAIVKDFKALIYMHAISRTPLPVFVPTMCMNSRLVIAQTLLIWNSVLPMCLLASV